MGAARLRLIARLPPKSTTKITRPTTPRGLVLAWAKRAFKRASPCNNQADAIKTIINWTNPWTPGTPNARYKSENGSVQAKRTYSRIGAEEEAERQRGGREGRDPMEIQDPRRPRTADRRPHLRRPHDDQDDCLESQKQTKRSPKSETRILVSRPDDAETEYYDDNHASRPAAACAAATGHA